jgi:hypothetical protein
LNQIHVAQQLVLLRLGHPQAQGINTSPKVQMNIQLMR